MPIKKTEGAPAFRVVCITEHDVSAEASGTTMRREENYFSLNPLVETGSGFKLGYHAFPIIVLVCSVCGYCELHSAQVAEPGRW